MAKAIIVDNAFLVDASAFAESVLRSEVPADKQRTFREAIVKVGAPESDQILAYAIQCEIVPPVSALPCSR